MTEDEVNKLYAIAESLRIIAAQNDSNLINGVDMGEIVKCSNCMKCSGKISIYPEFNKLCSKHQKEFKEWQKAYEK